MVERAADLHAVRADEFEPAQDADQPLRFRIVIARLGRYPVPDDDVKDR